MKIRSFPRRTGAAARATSATSPPPPPRSCSLSYPRPIVLCYTVLYYRTANTPPPFRIIYYCIIIIIIIIITIIAVPADLFSAFPITVPNSIAPYIVCPRAAALVSGGKTRRPRGTIIKHRTRRKTNGGRTRTVVAGAFQNLSVRSAPPHRVH